LAGVAAGLGVRTTLMTRTDRFLRHGNFDVDAVDALAVHMAAEGIVHRRATQVTRVERLDASRLRLSLSDGSSLITSCLLWAIGRAPATATLGLARAGVAVDARGRVKVTKYQQTSAHHVFVRERVCV